MTLPTCPTVPVSWGELIDKLTILEIKAERIERADALANVARERLVLGQIAEAALAVPGVKEEVGRLRHVNEQLWEIEDAIRAEEAAKRFGARFIELARAVYRTNDERAAIKRRLNDLLGSELVEEKSYAEWREVSQGAR